MTRIIVMSDSHGNLALLDDVLRKHENQEKILIHLGDRCYDLLSLRDDLTNVYLIRGNIETQSVSNYEIGMNEAIFDVENVKIFATHGHRYSVQSTMIFLKKEAKKIGAKLVLFGHTHEKSLELDEDILYFNPGALTNNDYGIIDIEGSEIVNIEHCYLQDRW